MTKYLRNISAVFIMLLFAESAHSQNYYDLHFSVGYYGNLDNVNRSLYKYNASRKWLTRPMTGINRTTFTGWDLSIGNPEYYMEAGISNYSNRTYAYGPQPALNDQIGRKEIKISNFSFYYGFIFKIWESNTDKVECIVGIAPAMEMLRSRVRYYENIDVNDVLVLHSASITWGARFSSSIKYYPVDWFGFVIKPVYVLSGKAMVNELHNHVLGIDAIFPADLNDKLSHFAISIGISISPNRY